MLNMFATLAEYAQELITEKANADIAGARASGTGFGRPPVDQTVIVRKLTLVAEEQAKGRTATGAAQLAGWSRATFYRHARDKNRSGAVK